MLTRYYRSDAENLYGRQKLDTAFQNGRFSSYCRLEIRYYIVYYIFKTNYVNILHTNSYVMRI